MKAKQPKQIVRRYDIDPCVGSMHLVSIPIENYKVVKIDRKHNKVVVTYNKI